MRLVIKTTLKNIFAKKGRTFLMLFLIIFTAFTAMLALDMSKNVKDVLIGGMKYTIGKTDLCLYKNLDESVKKEAPEADYLFAYVSADMKYTEDPDTYNYVIEHAVSVYAFDDADKAVEFGMLRENFHLTDDEAVVTSEFASSYNYKVGDKFTLNTSTNGDPVELTIKEIYRTNNQMLRGETVITTPENIRILHGTKNLDDQYVICMIDVKDMSRVKEYQELILKNDPTAIVENYSEAFEDDEMDSIANAFYLIFLIALLLVMFVSISTSEKIVTERMSTIGTLRSLGVSNGKTALILFAENLVYAVLGSVIGAVLYANLKVPVLSSFMIMEDSEGRILDIGLLIKPTPLYTYILMIVLLVVLVSFYPAIELIKAVKTPIRDIIFNNKDTQYKHKKTNAYIGGVLILVAIVTSFMNRSFAGICISLVSIVISIALLTPYSILGAGKLVEKIAGNRGKVLVKFAARNMYNNKTIVGTSVLIVTSMLLSLILTNMFMSEYRSMMVNTTDADVIVKNVSEKEADLKFLDSIECIADKEYIRSKSSRCKINGLDEDYIDVESQGEYKMYLTQKSIRETIGVNEMAISEKFAKKYNLKVGDEVKVDFDSDAFFPQERTLVVKEIVRSKSYSDMYAYLMVINPETYKDLFNEEISEILINSADYEEVQKILSKIMPNAYVQSREMKEQEIMEQTASLRRMLTAIIAFAVSLTYIGVSGNQTMGFETRRREFAVLYSTAMSKSKIYKLLFLENFFLVIIAAITTWIGTPFLTSVFNSAMALVTDFDAVQLSMDVKFCSIYSIGIMAFFMLSTLIPIKRIKKMNATEELKYE